jgi:hypothetical protein
MEVVLWPLYPRGKIPQYPLVRRPGSHVTNPCPCREMRAECSKTGAGWSTIPQATNQTPSKWTAYVVQHPTLLTLSLWGQTNAIKLDLRPWQILSTIAGLRAVMAQWGRLGHLGLYTPQGHWNFHLHYHVQRGPLIHLFKEYLATLSEKVNRPEREDDHSSPPTAEI